MDVLVFLKISRMRGVVRFGKKGKLAPRYVGPFPILERIGLLAYRLDLPASMAGIHNVFHVSMIRKCLRDPTDHIPVTEVEVEEDLSRVIPPVKILDRSEKITRRGRWKMVKIQWSENEKDVTWELEDKVRSLHPELFTLDVQCLSYEIRDRLGVLYRLYE